MRFETTVIQGASYFLLFTKWQRTEHTKEEMDMHMQFSRKAPNLERLNENKNTNLKFTIKKQDGLDFSDSE